MDANFHYSSNKRVILAGFLFIAMILLAACTNILATEPETAAATGLSQVTETSPVTDTPAASETPEVEATPTVQASATATIEIKELTIEDIGPEDKVFDRGRGHTKDAEDLPIKTGIVARQGDFYELNYEDTESDMAFGETGLRFAWLSAYLTSDITIDKEKNILVIPLAIEVNGSLIHFKLLSPFDGNNKFLSFEFLNKRNSLPGYEIQGDTKSQTFPDIEDFPVNLEVGKQILISVANPESKQQYIDGLSYLRNGAEEYWADTDYLIMKIDFLLNTIDDEEGYPAIVKLKNKSIQDGSSLYMFIWDFGVTGVTGIQE